MKKWISITAVLATIGIAPNAKAEEDQAKLGQLFRLEGRWRVEEVYPGGEKGRGDVSFKQELDDTCLIGEYRSKCKEIGSDVEGHSVFRYTPETGKYAYWWFDNYDNSYAFNGEYTTTKDAIVLVRDTTEDEKMRYTFKFEDENTVVFTMEFGQENKYDVALTATYERKGRRDDDEDEPKAKPKLRMQRGIR